MNVSVALGSFAASWLTFLCLPSAWSALDRSRVPSILHSFVASYIALSLVPTYWSAVTGPQAAPLWRPGSAYENAFLSGVVGFFSMDLTLGLFFKGVMQPAFVAHHLTVIGSILLGFASAGTPVNCMMMLHEISVPFTNLHGVLTPSSPLRAPNGVLVSFELPLIAYLGLLPSYHSPLFNPIPTSECNCRWPPPFFLAGC